MDSFEQAKIAGAFLIAALTIVLPKTLIDMRAESLAHKAGPVEAHTASAKPAKPGEAMAPTAAATGTAGAAPATTGGAPAAPADAPPVHAELVARA